ncbi:MULTISPECIES: hypothetical protein [unclassified Sulfitobacter]|jgi:hypothetical protein|uniref:hypothetical protein n=1 Tax=unclassified Sulfitobacter TaxID=196795 RepID=UPI001110A963|nr:hypothetical protein [Sulfitobacter sp. BSw21498]|tara:strand:+ start:2938 stop:3294 length:357 start_codon:yes stop_codon:yes gene_type:complete
MYKLILSIPLLIAAQVASADPTAINSVRVSKEGGLYKFDVTISHGDTGWDHFSDAWRILDTDGNQLAIRELIHPHVDEQPLTRSLSGIKLPAGTTEVGIQARETQSGWGKEIRKVQIK